MSDEDCEGMWVVGGNGVGCGCLHHAGFFHIGQRGGVSFLPLDSHLPPSNVYTIHVYSSSSYPRTCKRLQ